MESPRFENQSDCEDYIQWADEEIKRLKTEIKRLEKVVDDLLNTR